MLFARHGNTFENGETPRIVGANEDLPLTAEGRLQAKSMGRALRLAGISLSTVLAGPLRRTREFAQLAAAEAGFPGQISTDHRLLELDYGAWSGLTDGEVAARHGQASLDQWRLHGTRPDGAGWAPPEDSLRSRLADLARELPPASLCVTSNGILRYIMEWDRAAFEKEGRAGGFRVRTGHVCGFVRHGREMRMAFWNAHPDLILSGALNDQLQ